MITLNGKLAGFGVLLLTTALFVAAGRPVAAELPFQVQAAKRQEVLTEQVFDAVIQAVHESTVSAEITGRIVEVNFDVDDYVPSGSVLVRVSDVRQQADLAQAEATLKETQARLREARARFDRIKGLAAPGHVSEQERDRSLEDLNAAKARHAAAEAKLTRAREELNHTVVRAPYSGVVVKRHVELGETANIGQPLMTGFSLEKLRAETVVPQSLVAAVRSHGEARVILPELEGAGIPGEKLTFSPYADPYTHTFRVRVDLPKGDHGIYPGTFVKVAFVTGRARRLLVPERAVARRSEVTAVYVVGADQHISFRQVRLGRVHGEMIEVLAGIDEGERVAMDPVRAAIYLKGGERSR